MAAKWGILRAGEAEIPLTNVFVMLQAVAAPTPRPQEHRPDLPPMPERWEHAEVSPPGKPPMPEWLEHAEAAPPPEKPPAPVPLSQALKETPHLVILGEPGAGKSTTLQFVGLCFARSGWAAERLGLDEARLPVFLRLSEHNDCKPEGDFMARALSMQVSKTLQCPEEEARALLEAWSRDEGLVVLLDGLDEVREDKREAVREQITAFARSPLGRNARLVVTSRTAGYTSLGADFKEYTLKPFERPEEALPYLTGWLAALKPEWQAEAGQRAERLLEGMRARPALRRVLDNPLLLRLAAEVYAAREEIARSRADLYATWVEETWKRAVGRGVPQERKEALLEALEETAWQLHNDLPLRVPQADLDLLREKMGLLLRLEQGWAFAHATFREYFVARRLARAWRANQAAAWAFLRPRLHLDRWREPLLLLAGALEGDAAADLVRRVARAGSPHERLLRRDLFLALHLAGAAQRPEMLLRLAQQALEDKRENVREAAAKALGDVGAPAVPALLRALEDEDREVRRSAAKALGEVGAPAVPALLRALEDQNSDVRQAAAWALGEIGAPEAIPALRRVLEDQDSDVRQAAALALGEVGAPEVVPALSRALEDKSEDVRRAAAWALEQIGVPEAVSALYRALEDKSQWVCKVAARALERIGTPEAVPALSRVLEDEYSGAQNEAAKALGQIGAPEAVPTLLRALENQMEHVRWSAAESLVKIGTPAVPALCRALENEDREARRLAVWVLGKIGAPAVPALFRALEDESWLVRQAAAWALGQIGAPEAVPALCRALEDEKKWVREAAANALGQVGTPEAVPALRRALEDEYSDVRLAAANALGQVSAPEAVLALSRALEDENSNVRQEAAEALGQIGAPEAIPALRRALEDQDSNVRQAAAWALGGIGPPEAIPALCRALEDENKWVRRMAARALGQVGTPEAVPALSRALEDEDGLVREAAVQSLGDISTPEAVPALSRALEDENWDVREAAVEALGKIGAPEAVPALRRALEDEDRGVRWNAVEALGQIGAPEAVPALRRALEDQDSDVRKAAAEALGKIGAPQAIPALCRVLEDRSWLVRRMAARVLEKIGPLEALPAPLYRALEDDEEEWVRKEAAESLERWAAELTPSTNSKERQTQRALLRRAARALARAAPREDVYEPLSIVLAKLETLTLTYADPLQPLRWQRAARAIGGFLVTAGLVAALGLLVVFYAASTDLLREQWKSALQAWLDTHPAWALVALVVLVAVSAVVVEFIRRFIERLKK